MSSGVVILVAGTAGQYGNGNGFSATGSATTLTAPSSVVLNSIGDLYISDSGNCVIRKVAFDMSTIGDEIKDLCLRRWILLESFIQRLE